MFLFTLTVHKNIKQAQFHEKFHRLVVSKFVKLSDELIICFKICPLQKLATKLAMNAVHDFLYEFIAGLVASFLARQTESYYIHDITLVIVDTHLFGF